MNIMILAKRKAEEFGGRPHGPTPSRAPGGPGEGVETSGGAGIAARKTAPASAGARGPEDIVHDTVETRLPYGWPDAPPANRALIPRPRAPPLQPPCNSVAAKPAIQSNSHFLDIFSHFICANTLPRFQRATAPLEEPKNVQKPQCSTIISQAKPAPDRPRQPPKRMEGPSNGLGSGNHARECMKSPPECQPVGPTFDGLARPQSGSKAARSEIGPYRKGPGLAHGFDDFANPHRERMEGLPECRPLGSTFGGHCEDVVVLLVPMVGGEK